MFQHTDPQFQLDLYHQRAAEWHREAAADHLAHQVAAAGPRHPRWHWPSRRTQPARATAAS